MSLPRLLVHFTAISLLLPAAGQENTEPFFSHLRQITFSGKRAGEGYFSADGKRLIFQSERDPANPFFQIYILDLETGDTNRVSPGLGKTTCAWFFPDGKHVIFASTHADARATAKQDQELKDRAEGKQKRYSWDYDENYDLWQAATDGSGLRNLTHTRGYDAEGAVSPDGNWIAFASNRHGYTEDLQPEEKARFERQPSWLMDIYVMRSDGSEVKRLTDVRGYDGGAFFSADGRKICWRRFNEDEDRAEIWTMNRDGSDQKQITRMEAMSWAPFFHPSGKYLIFTTNKHGFDNFELYVVDAEGRHEPRRVTAAAGFDGLASFSPDGNKVTWTSSRTSEKTSQLFLADWNHAQALQSLGLAAEAGAAAPDTASMPDEITADDMRRHITYLASDAMEGRLTGTRGEQLATDYVAGVFKQLGLQPAGVNGSYFHPFEFTAGVALGEKNFLTWKAGEMSGEGRLNSDWTPLAFSSTGAPTTAGVVFAGYGMEVAARQSEQGRQEEYSSYVHLDVKDKWVLMLRYLPEGLSQEERVRFFQASSLRSKAMTARQKGARGIIIASGPNSNVRQQLVPLAFDASLAGSGVAAISVGDDLAASWLKLAGRDLKQLQTTLDKGEAVQGFEIPNLSVTTGIDIRQEKRTGRNVVAMLPAAERAAVPEPAVVVGAHVDHLGNQGGSDSRAAEADKHLIHHGADDNASGVAGLLEIAQQLAAQAKSGGLKSRRDIYFAAWSGEELGLLGSSAWLKDQAKAAGDENAKLGGRFCANVNMDMIGRMQKNVVIQGLGSSDYWAGAIERRNTVAGLGIQAQNDCFLPTDAMSFYLRGIPIFNLFTGSHDDYHKPSDTADKINGEAAARIAGFAGLIVRDLATSSEEPAYKEQQRPEEKGRGGFRVFLGTIPDYAQGDVEGVKLSGVAPLGPAAKAGLQAGDVIVKLAGKEIKNIYEYTDTLSALKIGQETDITAKRGEKVLPLKIIPGSRE